MSPLVAIHSLQKLWDGSSGLRPLTMTIEPHELVVVQGRSGTGKSTLLALLAGWCEPDAGTITWGGRSTGTTSRGGTKWRSCRRCSAWSVSSPPGRTSSWRCVVVALRSPRRVAARDAHARCVGAHRGRGPPSARDLTRAETTAALARALAAEPTLLLADEPTSHQDAATARRVVSVIRARAEAGSGVLMTTHDEMVAAAADRVITLD